MRRGFRRVRGGGVALHLDDEELLVLDSLLADLALLVAAPDPDPDADPLAVLVGIDDQADTPDDPALERLLPDAYPDDPAPTTEFRRFTERSLRDGKVGHASLARECLSRGGPDLDLSPDETSAFLGSLNDLRLVLGTRLGVSEDDELGLHALADDDPRAFAVDLYDWLTWLQDSLLHALGAS